MCSAERAAELIVKALKNKKRVAYISRRWMLVGWVLKLVPAFILEKT
jgi:short-subunit dehydrogenase